MDEAENLPAFGMLGQGKTHLACAIGLDLIQAGRTFHFMPNMPWSSACWR